MGQPLPISRIMHTGVLLQCEPDTTIADAAARMSETSVSSILITDGGTVVGIWTEHDALAIDFADPAKFRQPVSTVMSSPVLSLPDTLDAGEAAVRLRDTGKRHFLVTNGSGEPVGILSQTDLALNQGLEPYLLQFTARVKDCLREDDTLARLGGDEFIVLLPEMEQLSDVFAVADRLIEVNKRPYQINGNHINVGSSIGISLYPEDGTTVQELINGADIAMYRAKRDGRNRYKLFNPEVCQSA